MSVMSNGYRNPTQTPCQNDNYNRRGIRETALAPIILPIQVRSGTMTESNFGIDIFQAVEPNQCTAPQVKIAG